MPSSVSQSIGSWKGGSTAANDLWDSRIKLGGRQKKNTKLGETEKSLLFERKLSSGFRRNFKKRTKASPQKQPFLGFHVEFLLELLLFWDDKRKGWRVISLFSRMNLNNSSSYYLYAQMFSFYVGAPPPP